MSARIEAEELEAIILKCKCPSGKCKSLADMVIMRTAHEGVFDHIDVHCDECNNVFNTTLMFMSSTE